MSKIAAIDTAVRLQMGMDGREVKYTENLNVAKGYTTSDDVQRFLLGIANRLRLDTPPLNFDWASIDATELLTKTLWLVISLIEQKTTGAT